MITWIYGQSGAGKTTLARNLRNSSSVTTVHLDGDDLRSVWTDLGLDEKSRREQNNRAANLAALLDSQGFDVIVSTICPYKDQRAQIKERFGNNCKFIFVEGGKMGQEGYFFEI